MNYWAIDQSLIEAKAFLEALTNVTKIMEKRLLNNCNLFANKLTKKKLKIMNSRILKLDQCFSVFQLASYTMKEMEKDKEVKEEGEDDRKACNVRGCEGMCETVRERKCKVCGCRSDKERGEDKNKDRTFPTTSPMGQLEISVDEVESIIASRERSQKEQ